METDAEALAALAERPVGVVRKTIHDRSVRVALPPDRTGPESESSGDVQRADAEPIAYVAFDAQREGVHISGFAGDPDAVRRLLEDPVRFGSRERMSVEAVVDRDDETRRRVLEAAGFEDDGSGPSFKGNPTVRYRIDPDEVNESSR